MSSRTNRTLLVLVIGQTLVSLGLFASSCQKRQADNAYIKQLDQQFQEMKEEVNRLGEDVRKRIERQKASERPDNGVEQ